MITNLVNLFKKEHKNYCCLILNLLYIVNISFQCATVYLLIIIVNTYIAMCQALF